jgi:hypothetical protein
MSSSPAIVKQRDVTRIMRGARAAGVELGIIIKNGQAHFVPLDQIKEESEPSALEAWRAKRNADKARGRS